MKKSYWVILVMFMFRARESTAQQLYFDFEGTRIAYFGMSSGVMDSLAVNPSPGEVNNSAGCAKYIRDTTLYDFIRVYPIKKLSDITPYADNNIQAPKIKMKLYSSAPPSTPVQLQFGLKGVDNYPAGVHSEYVALTSVQNAWQEITFNYFQSPQGSLVQPTEIDKVVILFNPNTHNRDTVYFDDLSGPELFDTGVLETETYVAPLKLYQNIPNPVKETTHIHFKLNSGGPVSLKIYDLLGNSVLSVLENSNMTSGNHSIPVLTSAIPNGLYFYILKKDGYSQAMRMLVSR